MTNYPDHGLGSGPTPVPTKPVTRRVALGWLVGLLAACTGTPAAPDGSMSVQTVKIECVGCHAADYNGARSPDHVGGHVVKQCGVCHGKKSWSPAAWDHKSWPLTGKHAKSKCAACHADARGHRIAKPSRLCQDCHLVAYAETTAPDHLEEGFPLECESCHTTRSWSPASFNHDSWPLTGKHAKAKCAACHADAQGHKIARPPKTCDGCHMPDYQGTKNPVHTPAAFPTACQACHGTSGWKPAGMTNHKFPITWGKHRKLQCSQCHENPSDWAAFTCMSGGCHPKNKTDKKHWGEVGGYVYSAKACYKCHPSGQGEGGGGD